MKKRKNVKLSASMRAAWERRKKTDGQDYGYLVIPMGGGVWYTSRDTALERAADTATKSPGARIMICQAVDTLVAQVAPPTHTKLR